VRYRGPVVFLLLVLWSCSEATSYYRVPNSDVAIAVRRAEIIPFTGAARRWLLLKRESGTEIRTQLPPLEREQERVCLHRRGPASFLIVDRDGTYQADTASFRLDMIPTAPLGPDATYLGCFQIWKRFLTYMEVPHCTEQCPLPPR
jgi:hypothetical protein